MSTSSRHRPVTLLLLLCGLFLVFIGTMIHQQHQLIGLGIEHLGIGVFAVMLLKFTVEEATQNAFLGLLRKDVKEEVTKSVINMITRSSWILSQPDVVQELGRIILPKFMRPSYSLSLKLEPLNGRKDLLRAWITMDYVVQNVSAAEEPYEVEAWLDNIIKSTDTTGDAKPGFTRVEIDKRALDIPELVRKGTSEDSKGGAIYYEEHGVYLKKLTIGPIKSQGTSNVVVEGMQLMRTEDHFVWNLPRITAELNLSIELTGGLTFEQLEVCPREMHHIDHEKFMDAWDTSEPTVRKLKIDQVLLPFQGIELRWAPKPSTAVNSSATLTPSTKGA